MRVGFFGGSFDPPHRGHLAVAEEARKVFGLERVLLAPVAAQPLKARAGYAGYADRLQMVAALCAGRPGLFPSELDAPRPNGRPNYTLDTLRKLKEEAPDDTIYSIVGMDAFRDFRQWRGPDELLRISEWIVVHRPGSSFEHLGDLALSPEQHRRVHLLASVDVPVSATEIRARLAAGESCSDFVPEKVLAFIRERHLYGGEKGPAGART